MLKPIKAITILTGRDAVNFHRTIKENQQTKPNNSKLADIRRDASALKSIFKGIR